MYGDSGSGRKVWIPEEPDVRVFRLGELVQLTNCGRTVRGDRVFGHFPRRCGDRVFDHLPCRCKHDDTWSDLVRSNAKGERPQLQRMKSQSCK